MYVYMVSCNRLASHLGWCVLSCAQGSRDNFQLQHDPDQDKVVTEYKCI